MDRLDPTAADTILDLPAYKRTYLARGWMLKGSREKGSWSYPQSQQTLLSHRSICEFDACERVVGALLLHQPSFSSSSLSSSRTPPPVLAQPSVPPVAPSGSAGTSCMICVATIHTARAGLLQQHDTERDALRDYKATASLLDVPRAYDLTPDAVSRPHAPDLRTPQIRRAALDMRPYSRAWGPLHPFPIAYGASLATRPRRPSLGLPHSLPRRLFLSRSASHGRRASPARAPIVPVALIAARHTTIVFSGIPPSPLGACASVHPQPGVHGHRRAQRPPRPFLLAGVLPVASALAATSSAPSHSKPASATQQKHDARPQRGLQHLQHRLPIACVGFVASPHAATFLVPFPIADAYRIPAAATTLCAIPSLTQLAYAHFGTICTAPLPLAQRAAPGSEEGPCGRLQREIAAHTQREDTPQWAPAAIAGTGATFAFKFQHVFIV
ncbi:hypothetical protein B0H14DRAFT_3880054 [Mycena olivaceomarginata]|nr:hypothetical protein B0H14DRAFT_3880054 [Mycena olivaceomarginata]